MGIDMEPPMSGDPLAPMDDDYGKMLDTYGNEFKVPDFTIKQIRDAIPAHCFERSALRSSYYVVQDILCSALTFAIAYNFVTPEIIPSTALRVVAWNIYGFLQGLLVTGIWMLAHECGHQSFSTSKVLNDTVGWFLHSACLTPYFAWKISHGKHHKATGHMERDMIYLPRTREMYASWIHRTVDELSEIAEEAPFVTLLIMIIRQTLGWPLYLFQNNTGHDFHERQPEGRGKGKRNGRGGGVSHFSIYSPLYEAKDAKYIALSDLGVGLMALALYQIGKTHGWQNLALWYFLPYVWMNNWLATITYLHHTDPSLPHYTPATWTFTRGAAATMDRDFGIFGRFFFHGIVDTHVLHHYCSTIPHYHAEEATEAIKPVMGVHYHSYKVDGPWGYLRSMWHSLRWCQWVEPSAEARGKGREVLFYRNRNGFGVKPAPGGRKGE